MIKSTSQNHNDQSLKNVKEQSYNCIELFFNMFVIGEAQFN